MKTVARLVEGDPGKVICQEAERIKPAAVVLGTRGRGLIQRFDLTLPPSIWIMHLSLNWSILWFFSVCYREVLGSTACTTVKQHLLWLFLEKVCLPCLTHSFQHFLKADLLSIFVSLIHRCWRRVNSLVTSGIKL